MNLMNMNYDPPGIAFVNGTNSLGETPLFLACKLGNLEVAKACVEWGAEPDARDKEVRNAGPYGGIVVCRIVVLFLSVSVVGLMDTRDALNY